MTTAGGKAVRVPAYRAASVWDQVKRQRRAAQSQRPPDDIRGLPRPFRNARVADGYQLGYIRIGSRESGWIWPYAARQTVSGAEGPPPELAEIPVDRLAASRLQPEMRPTILATLNRQIVWQPDPAGLLEYALLVRELWSLKSESRERDWIGLDFVLTRHALQQILRRAGRSTLRIGLESQLDPAVVLERGGGTAMMLAFVEKPWMRIVEVELKVDPDGWLTWSAGRVALNLAS